MAMMKRLSESLLAVKVGVVAEGNNQQNDPALVEWASWIPLDQIPGLLLVLASRRLVEATSRRSTGCTNRREFPNR